MESDRVSPAEFGGRRQIAVGAGQLALALIRVLKVKADVKSPTTARRHGEILSSCTPNRFSMNWTTDV
jgi:hypothetical protein